VGVRRRRELSHELRRAIEDDALELHYQPQVDLGSERLVGVEALARWTHPRLGAVGPDEFIPVAEACGLIDALGAWVLRTATRQLAAWRRRPALAALTMTVNVSVHQLADPRFPDVAARALAGAALPASALCVELTETALMSAADGALDVLRALKALGIYVAIDDFGTGYSSLASLRGLPVEVLRSTARSSTAWARSPRTRPSSPPSRASPTRWACTSSPRASRRCCRRPS
jgi:EAL domain-containing protein (putative c-di-GMP-specific phosphodiesterase class I)